MKRYGILMLMLSAMLLTGVANAQSGEPAIKADVPFNFTVDNQSIPAGAVQVRSEGQAGTTLVIANTEAKANAFVLPMKTQSLNPSERTVLVFNKYGDRYFLARIERADRELTISRVINLPLGIGFEKSARFLHQIGIARNQAETAAVIDV